MSNKRIKRLSSEFNFLSMATKKYRDEPSNQEHRFFIDDGTKTETMANDKLVVWLRGPEKTSYAGVFYKLEFKYPPDYPFVPPTVKFGSLMYHPNVSQDSICLDLLTHSAWTPALTTEKLLHSLSSLLENPNPSDPLNSQAASEYSKKYKDFCKKNLTIIQKMIKNRTAIRDEYTDFIVVEDVVEKSGSVDNSCDHYLENDYSENDCSENDCYENDYLENDCSENDCSENDDCHYKDNKLPGSGGRL